MNKCQCDSPGYCNFFNQEMTSNPPNWQWCQSASEEERLQYKDNCDIKHKRKNFNNINGSFLTYQNLVDTCLNDLIPKLSKMNVSGIMGVPRSGYLPASICATSMNLPLYNIYGDQTKVAHSISEFGGYRMGNYKQKLGKIVVLDDTVFSGDTIQTLKGRFGDEYHYAALYVNPNRKNSVDVFAKELDEPHLLEWHFFNSDHVENTLFDLDGVFSPNIPLKHMESDDKYEEYISKADPIFHRLPKMFKCKGIVTARLDKFKKVTEEWLNRHGIKYDFLSMYPTEKRDIRDANHVEEAGKYKAEVYKNSNARFFMESEKAEGVVIRKMSNKLVILPNDGIFI